MEDVILRISEYRPLVEDALESLDLLITESHEIQLIIISVLFITLVSVITIYERLRIKGWKCLVPVYRWFVLFKALGLNPWLSLLMYLPGINIIMLIVFYVYMVRVFKCSYAFIPGLILLPIVFLPIIAFTDGKCDHYQPHAKLVDLPPELGSEPVVAKAKKASTNRIRVPVTPIASTKIRKQIVEPIKKVPNVIRIQIQDANGDKAVKRNFTSQIKKTKPRKRGGYLDIKATPKKKAQRVSQKKALPPIPQSNKQQKLEKAHSNQSNWRTPNQPVATKPIPGDIRLMKNNIVVIGALSEPTPKGKRYPAKLSKKNHAGHARITNSTPLAHARKKNGHLLHTPEAFLDAFAHAWKKNGHLCTR